MIVIKAEMWPLGDESRKYEIGSAKIINDAYGSIDIGAYNYQFCGGVAGREDLLSKIWKKGHIDKFPRRERGLWDLLYLCLKSAVGGRNK